MITDDLLKELALEQHIPLNDVFMKDDPPNKIKYGGYIVNLDDEESGRGGTHWTCLWFPRYINKPIIYFDSFGFIIPQSLINWIKNKGGYYKNSKILCNDKQIQNVDTGGCGIYSLYFLDFVSKHPLTANSITLLNNFNKKWDTDTKNNLNLLKKYAPYYAES